MAHPAKNIGIAKQWFYEKYGFVEGTPESKVLSLKIGALAYLVADALMEHSDGIMREVAP